MTASTDLPTGGSLRSLLGTLLCRFVVPMWVLTGALFKLIEGSPKLLPKNILLAGDKIDLDLEVLLVTLIAIEFLIAGVMLFVARLARPAAIFMLSVFNLVLIGEIAAGNTSCGCLGAHSPSPWVMLTIDLALLLGVLFLRGGRSNSAMTRPWPALAALALALVGAGASYGTIMPRSTDLPPPPPRPNDGETPTPQVSLPSYWFESDFASWIGQRYSQLELVQFMNPRPTGLDEGERYLVFYRRTCDHCQDMFEHDFVSDPALAARVIAVEVPEDEKVMTGDTAWAMPETACSHMQLPLGVDWIITTPLAVRLEDGVVKCATEGDHSECMGLEPHEH